MDSHRRKERTEQREEKPNLFGLSRVVTDEGQANGCFNERAASALAGRDVVLMPDLGATQEWQARLPMLDKVCRSVSVNGMLEMMATEEQRSQGLDIADFLLMEDTPQMILQKMIDRNPALQTLIDGLSLELTNE